MSVSARWLLAIIVLGLVQFGTFLAEIKALRTDVMDVKIAFKEFITTTQHVLVANAVEHAEFRSRLLELERRMNVREERNPLEGKRH